MTPPVVAVSTLRRGGADGPVLVVGPSLGTSVETLWRPTVDQFDSDITVLGWDLPGHGLSAPASGFGLADLAAAVIAALDEGRSDGLRPFDGLRERSFAYAGDSLGAAVGLQLLLDASDRISTAILCCTGPRIGTPAGWHERAAAVRGEGMQTLLAATPARWFGPGFAVRSPELADTLLGELAGWDVDSYAACCEALAAFDIRARLAEIDRPVLAVAGSDDQVTPPAGLRQIADGVQYGQLAILDGVAHLAPAEAPDRLAVLIARALARPAPEVVTTAATRANGMRVRREVLGDAHVDRASARATDFTAEFQRFITSYAWGSIWTRPGLDRRSRSMITLTALIARGHHEELAMHVRAALTNGLTPDEIKEVILQSAIYCGVPDANTAFRIAQQVLAEGNQE